MEHPISATEPSAVQVEQLPDGASCVVWLRKNFELLTADNPDGEPYEYWSCDEISFIAAGTPSTEEIEANLETLWAEHEQDGLTTEERIEAMVERLDEQDAALMELGDLLGGE